MAILPLPSDVQRFAGLPAVLYGRVSTKIQEADGYSLPNQRRESAEAAALLQVNVIAEDFEQGSGQDWDLEGINEHIRRVERGEVKAIILKNVSRLSRKRGKQAWIEHLLAEAGALVWYYDESYADSAAGRLQRGIMAEVAEFQLEQAREDSMKARYEKVEQYKRPVGNGPIPYGWRRVWDTSGSRPRTVGYEHDEHEVAVIRRLRKLLHVSVQALCDQFNAEGLAVPGAGRYRPNDKRTLSGRWTPSTIWGILNNPMTWGEYRYGARQVVKRHGKARVVPKPNATVRTLQLDPILPAPEVTRIRASLVERRQRRTIPAERPNPFILTGRLLCGHCGGTLATKWGGGPRYRMSPDYRAYGCLRHSQKYAERRGKEVCPMPDVAATRRPGRGTTDGIEEIVWQMISEELLDPERLRAKIERSQRSENGVAEHEARVTFQNRLIAQKREALQRTTDLWSETADPLDRETLADTRERLMREVRSLRAELAALVAYVPKGITRERGDALLEFAADARDELADASAATKRGFLHDLEVIGRVTADPEGPYQIGRHRYAIDWDGAIPLGGKNDNSAGNFQKFRMREVAVEELGLQADAAIKMA